VVKVYGCILPEDRNLTDGITVATFIMKSGQRIEGEESKFPSFRRLSMDSISSPRLAPAVSWLVLTLVFLSASSYTVSAQLAEGIVKGETMQGYQFMSGGVGSGERDAMLEQAKSYNLALSFAAPSGQYLSDVRVLITDERGKEVVNTTAVGPLFYVELPGGRYNITASYDGRSQEIKGLQIPNSGRVSKVFHWNVPIDEFTQR
jgi:hypothetical protein